MKLAVFGAGYVGLVTGACFSELGNEVTIIDINKKRVDDLKKGIIPIHEPGLSQLIKKNVSEKRLFFTTEPKAAIINSKVIFVAVGTPSNPDGSTDLSQVISVAKTIGENIDSYKVIVSKSTVPVGTADLIRNVIRKSMKKKINFDVVSNPEFLKEGAAVRDFLAPDRVVIGSDSDKATSVMKELYSGVIRVERPLFLTTVRTAEIIKYASNAMLASRISFMNQLSHLCDAVGADIKDVATGIGMDKRIGSRYLQAGLGYGGSCFPKDVKSLASTLRSHGLDATLIDSIDKVNERQKTSIIPRIKKKIKEFHGKNICIWGIAFKPKTDDMREAPAISIINQLLLKGSKITAFDPVAMDNAKKIFANKIGYAKDMYTCAKNADCIILATEWDEFRNPDWQRIKKLMKGKIIVDGRNIYDQKIIKTFGFDYIGVGR